MSVEITTLIHVKKYNYNFIITSTLAIFFVYISAYLSFGISPKDKDSSYLKF